MECNKEEAFRAKSIAEKKLQEKDFVGARKFSMKAQELYPETENITQMVCVCDVHCASQSKMIGNELDWYGILQIEHSADDVLIKKQYRKLAFLLHPDKNKFSGAESAFKLLGEAQRVLLDREKRSLHDMRRRTNYKPVVANQASKGSNVTNHSRVQRNFVNNPSSDVKGFSAHDGNTFWTQCPFCNIRYQFYKEVQDRAVRCQNCTKPFVALNLNDRATRPRSNITQPVFSQKEGSNVRVNAAVNKKPISKPVSQEEVSKSRKSRQSQKGSQSSKRANIKRGNKFTVESSDGLESDTSDDLEGLEMQFDDFGDSHSRKSSRNKRRVLYNENASDDDETMCIPKKAKGSGSSSPSLTEKKSDDTSGESVVVEPMKKSFHEDNDDIEDSNPEITPEPTFHEYPDPEFCDFDKGREVHCFKVGQVWAAYDTVDAMPRFYARIKRVYSRGFKLQITWLEPDPDDEDEHGLKWVESELPFSCGNFKFGDSECTKDYLMFSHEVCLEKGRGKDSIKIYPKKGETWALFKNWDAKWYETLENERKFEYEFVEVISEYDETVGIRVTPLCKLKAYASLFSRVGGDEVQIPSTEILRFAHRVPSYKMTGNEGQDVPEGSFELDPASIGIGP